MEAWEPQAPRVEEQQTGKWYTPLTRVTPLSRYLALALFVVLPFLGFWLGVEYGRVPQQDVDARFMPEGTTSISRGTPESGVAQPIAAYATTSAQDSTAWQTSEGVSGGEILPDTNGWIHHSVHEPSVGGKADSFDVMTPSDWVMRTDSDSSTGGPWVLQSTPFEHDLHGTGEPEPGGMRVQIHAGCTATKGDGESSYVRVADEGDKYPPFVERVTCVGGYEVTASLWSDDPNYVLHVQTLNEVLTSFSVGNGAVP